MISDPAALQYIFVKSGYRFPKPREFRTLSQMVNGKGILSVEGWFLTRLGMRVLTNDEPF